MSDNQAVSCGGDDSSAGRLYWKVIIWAAAAVGLLWLILGILLPVWSFPGGNDPRLEGLQARSAFGDQFGAVNALFSGLALAGVVLALILQRRELSQSIAEHKAAARQHAAVGKIQILLQLSDEIRGQEWGDAHFVLTRWRIEHGDSFVDRFREDRDSDPRASEIDRARRTFMRPLYKVWHLRHDNLIKIETAKQVISLNIATTAIHIVRDMTQAVAETIDPERTMAEPECRLFQMIEDLYGKIPDPFAHQEPAD